MGEMGQFLKYNFLFFSLLFFTLLAIIQPFKHFPHMRHQQHARKSHSRSKLYLNEFAVEIEGGHEYASALARKYGFVNLGQVGSLEGWYTFVDRRIRKRSLELEDRSGSKLRRLKREVLKVERLKVLRRRKRDPILSVPAQYDMPNDPSWDEMWYMRCGTGNDSGCPVSMRIIDAWRAGFNGEGVVATILDDGIEFSHPDLSSNYDPDASWDFNDEDDDPRPRYDTSDENKHGTRCAGVLAAAMDNYICGVGVAYRINIGGVRMLDGDVTDRIEASALNFAHNHIDIYSASWGPEDDGETVEGPGAMTVAAFKHGALHGRGGKGSIFVWASGNGGFYKDSCSCDGYINSIYTIGISSASKNGYRPWYNERCTSTLAATYSSGEHNEGRIITTDLHSSCTRMHTGTSASAPMAAGIVAMMLQANPELSWRDVQHIIVRTSRLSGLAAPDWVVNGAGYNVSNTFGFGMMDAAAGAHVAGRWEEVPEQKMCVANSGSEPKMIEQSRPLRVRMDTRACHREANEVAYLEHVVMKISLKHPRRGDLEISLTSPSGTISNILERRDYDPSKAGFSNWEFMTTHHWGENPMGVWLLEIRDSPSSRQYRDPRRKHMLIGWELILYGTTIHPQPNYHFENCEAFPQDHCHPECDGCCGATAVECRACRHVSSQQGECVRACSASQFEDSGVCKPCWHSCLTCDDAGPSNCTSCHHGNNIVDGACVKTCQQGFYLEPTTQTCRICDEICQTCQDRSNICTSCRSSFIFEGDTCRPSCPFGSYFASVAIGCRPCNESCEGCLRSPRRCIACARGYVMHRQKCSDSCPKRYYPDHAARTCRECHSDCRACSGPNESQCTRCFDDKVLNHGYCQETCQDAYELTSYLQNPCTLVLRYRWCGMQVFALMCCQTCAAFDENVNATSVDVNDPVYGAYTGDDDDGGYIYGDDIYDDEPLSPSNWEDSEEDPLPGDGPVATNSTLGAPANVTIAVPEP